MPSNRPEEFFWGAVVGGAIGIAAALIWAPSSGEKLRKTIVNGFSPEGPKQKAAPRRRSHYSASIKTAPVKAKAAKARVNRRGNQGKSSL